MRNRMRVLLPVLLTLVLTGFISFSNHLAFRTYALDLGLYTQHAWNYFNGNSPDLSMVGRTVHALADHFDLYLIFLSPFAALGGAWALLVAQWLSFGVGCSLACRLGRRERTGMFLGLYFVCLWPVIQAAGFDYHSNVIAAMGWLLWWQLMRNRRHAWSWILLILLWVGKEDMPLWMTFSALGGALHFRTHRRTFLLQSGASFIFFLVVIGVLMPAFPSDGAVSNLGKYGMIEQLFSSVTPLVDSLQQLLISLLHSPEGGIIDSRDVRHEFWAFFLLSGGWLLIRRPAFLIMLLPLIFSKMWHDNPLFGGTLAHHNIALVPVLIAAAHDFLKNASHKTAWALLLILPALSVTVRSLDRPVNRSAIANTRFYQFEKFIPKDLSESHALLQEIPHSATVSAMSQYVPHLAGRRYIYEFPVMCEKADYVIITHREETYPLSIEERNRFLEAFTNEAEWENSVSTKAFSIFKRRMGQHHN